MKRKWYNIHCECDSSWGDCVDPQCGISWTECPVCNFYVWVSASENEMMSALQDMNE